MFNFGRPEDTAQLYWDAVGSDIQGPPVPRGPVDEMTELELQIALTYLYMAYEDADREGANDEVLAILMKQYDEAFQALAEVSERFLESVRSNRIQWLGGHTRENANKYRVLAGLDAMF